MVKGSNLRLISQVTTNHGENIFEWSLPLYVRSIKSTALVYQKRKPENILFILMLAYPPTKSPDKTRNSRKLVQTVGKILGGAKVLKPGRPRRVFTNMKELPAASGRTLRRKPAAGTRVPNASLVGVLDGGFWDGGFGSALETPWEKPAGGDFVDLQPSTICTWVDITLDLCVCANRNGSLTWFFSLPRK